MFVFLFFVVSLFSVGADAVLVNTSDPIMCGNLGLHIPLQGNTAAIQMILDICLASPRCANLYSQSNGAKSDLFTFLFETTTLFQTPIFFDSPINEFVCNYNATLEELNAVFWLLRLELDLFSAGRDCGIGEDHFFNEETQQVNCRACPSCKVQRDEDIRTLFLVFGFLALFGLVLILGMMVWKVCYRQTMDYPGEVMLIGTQ